MKIESSYFHGVNKSKHGPRKLCEKAMNVDGLINNIILYYFGGLKNKIIIQAQKMKTLTWLMHLLLCAYIL